MVQTNQVDLTLPFNPTIEAPPIPGAATPSSLERDIRTTTLSNGIKVITESMHHVRSVSVGVWVGSGSRRETPHQNGGCDNTAPLGGAGRLACFAVN